MVFWTTEEIMQQNKVCNHILSKRNGDFRVPVEVLLNAKGCCIDVPKSAVLTSQKDSSEIYFWNS